MYKFTNLSAHKPTSFVSLTGNEDALPVIEDDVSFVPDIQRMMYGLGDVPQPHVESAALIESITLDQILSLLHQASEIMELRGGTVLAPEDILFLMKRNHKSLKRLITYLGVKDEAQLHSSALNGNLPSGAVPDIMTIPETEEDILKFPQVDLNTPLDWKKGRKKYCLVFLKNLNIEESDLNQLVDLAKETRLNRINNIALSLSPMAYESFHAARCKSFCSNNITFGRFLKWVAKRGGWNEEISQPVLDILIYVAKETVACVVDMVMTLKEEADLKTKKCSVLSSAITPDEIREVIRQCGKKTQVAVYENESIIPNLFAFVHKMHLVQPPNPDSTLAFSVGVQCIANLMSNNDTMRNYVADNFAPNISEWLKTEGSKQQNYVCAVLLNLDQVGKLSRELYNKEFVRDLVRVSESGSEFGILLLQNFISCHLFRQLYDSGEEEQKVFLLQLLDSMITDESYYAAEVTAMCNKFKKACDRIMTEVPSAGPYSALELAILLEFMCSTSYKSGYISSFQSDSSLVVSSSYLLRGIHEVVSQKKNWKESLKEAVDVLKNKNSEMTNKPFFGVKGNLIRLLGNLAFRNKRNQDLVREAGCIPIILDSCKLDGDNPFIKEWSILTIRNLCDGNPENQTFIKNMNYQGCDFSVAQELSLSLDGGEGSGINIAPVLRRS
ncbi:hypothetical protein GE061_008951 [Apolygus lucorum]|uniref:Ataxin-10 n=1 Tax=Apolygus lucorum TaxID=248454 RepID=A0A6A4KAY6_APOLU|nr:hypothetical protein GE061_008951 [Apolygus lucorum]